MSYTNLLKIFSKEKYLLILGILVISVVFSPYLYFGEDSHIPIFDNLESNVVWVKMVLDQGGIFLPPTATVDQIMNGLPHASVYGGYDISLMFFTLFGSFWGYVFNKYLLATIGFFGMYFLLKKHILPESTPLYIPVAVSVLFALLPFWSFTATVSGLPMALLAFLNLRQRDSGISNWLMLLLFAFYSSLVLTGFFLLLVVLCIFLRDLFKTKKVSVHLLLGMIFLSLAYFVSHLPLFLSFFAGSSFIPHRVEFVYSGESLNQVLKSIINILVNGDTSGHALALQTFMIIPIIFALLLMIKRKEINKVYILIIIYVILSSVLYGIERWAYLVEIKMFLLQVIPVDFKRFYWLNPICWLLLFAISLFYISKVYTWGKYITIVALTIQFVFVLVNQPYYTSRHIPTFRAFYAEEQFNDIKTFIGKDVASYKVVSIWLHPAISQYNGFYTLDGFSANYPLTYKHQFRKIIGGELDKNEGLKKYFDGWGSRCYAYSAECGQNDLIYNNHLPKIEHLDYNYDVLKEMGGQYIISGVEINTENNPRLELLKVFDDYGASHWTIYLYKVN